MKFYDSCGELHRTRIGAILKSIKNKVTKRKFHKIDIDIDDDFEDEDLDDINVETVPISSTCSCGQTVATKENPYLKCTICGGEAIYDEDDDEDDELDK